MKYMMLTALFLSFHFTQACTTILVGKNATKDGSVILAHNEDMGKKTEGILKYYQARKYPPNSMLRVPYVELEQMENTYGFWGAGNVKNVSGLGISDQLPYEYNHILVGMNENGVAMACNWMNSKEENLKEEGIRRYAIRQLVLERAKTAKEAVDIITAFIDQYHQADWGGLTYNVADSEEAWVIETTSYHWVARRVKDDEVWAVANRFTITDDYDLASEGLVDYAYHKKWIDTKNERINFRATFGKYPENNQDYDVERENLVYNELLHRIGAIDAPILMKLLRHRYQNEPNFKPITAECWRDYCEEKKVKRPLSSCLTQSSIIAKLHAKYKKVGGKMWYLHASPHTGIYFPVYGNCSAIEATFQTSDDGNHSSSWWKFRLLQQKVDQDYYRLNPKLLQYQNDIQHQILKENEAFERTPKQHQQDWALHQKKLSEMALDILTK